MDELTRISKVFEAAEEIPFDSCSRIVLMSDCHRGDGTWADDFSKNQNSYFAALSYYYREDYTYIELGDGDELWENSKFSDIIQIHRNIFWIMSKFYEKGKLHIIFGNHDIEKKDKAFLKSNLYEYYDERKKRYFPVFPDIKAHEGLILKDKDTGNKIFLIHGHQGDWLNDKHWKFGRFLVRYFWRTLENLGINDPTSAAKNYKKKNKTESGLVRWVKKEKKILIAGHTHRPMFPEVGEPPYFNDGSAVHPRCITAIEIIEGCISLVKWSIKTRKDGTLFIGRDILAGPRKIKDYYDEEKKQ